MRFRINKIIIHNLLASLNLNANVRAAIDPGFFRPARCPFPASAAVKVLIGAFQISENPGPVSTKSERFLGFNKNVNALTSSFLPC